VFIVDFISLSTQSGDFRIHPRIGRILASGQSPHSRSPTKIHISGEQSMVLGPHFAGHISLHSSRIVFAIMFSLCFMFTLLYVIRLPAIMCIRR